ncbi:fimbrial protein [Gallibacterium genomosp. 3]|uniref:Fimbrial protein n=1 Tax=Gallibacterium genomosp. 3 TaxID=505345 RepID=A0A1A7PUX9_9PAST|nr:fimbria/pilus outer membrane usher protein [Gallibacterium genomosp. 3]OBX05546.1 fimbrial protein [Gallibacterium genomosp. 3]
MQKHNVNRFKLCLVYSAVLMSLMGAPSFVQAEEEYVEFNPIFLRGVSSDEVDVSRFSYGNPVAAGEYVADIYLNEQLKGRIALQFAEVPNKHTTALCMTDSLLSVLDLSTYAFTGKATQDNAQCSFLIDNVPEVKINFDLSTLRLDVHVPQAYINQRPPGYISPAQWQDGVPVAFVRYDASHYQYRYGGIKSEQTYLGVEAGINLFGWALRHRGSQSWQDQVRSPYQSISTYAQHDIALLRGQLTIGDFYTSGLLMDSLPLRGVQLASDDRMLASSVRGYAPIIRGVANSNAKVIIRQNGRILKEVTVPAGPFSIEDLYPTGYGGDIDVEILEANGEKRTFSIPYTATAQLIRPGYSRYQIAVGRYRYGEDIYPNNIAQATWQYGLTNNITLNMGATATKNYHAELVGLAFNTPIGAFATNATFSNAVFTNSGNKRKGYSLYASYNTRIEPTNTNVTLAAYRYLSRDYFSLQEVLTANNSQFLDDIALDLGAYTPYRPKNQFNVAINQALKKQWGHLYLTGSTSTYWDSHRKQYEYQLGYSNYYKRLNYSVSFSQARTNQGEKDNRFYLNLSLPLGNESYTYLSQSLNVYQQNQYTTATSISGTLGKERNYSYSLSFNRNQNNLKNYAASGNYTGSWVNLNGTWGRDSDRNQQYSVSASGAVVAHPKGITLTNYLDDTFAIIHAKGASGAKINGAIANKLDYFGNGILSYLEPYSVNYVGIDTTDIPDSVELSATEQQVIPRANSAMLIDFATKTGQVVFLELTEMPALPSIGTEVLDEQQRSVGVVAQGGRIYTRGLSDKGQLTLSWAGKQCRIDYQISNRENNRQILIIPVVCKE